MKAQVCRRRIIKTGTNGVCCHELQHWSYEINYTTAPTSPLESMSNWSRTSIFTFISPEHLDMKYSDYCISLWLWIKIPVMILDEKVHVVLGVFHDAISFAPGWMDAFQKVPPSIFSFNCPTQAMHQFHCNLLYFKDR